MISGILQYGEDYILLDRKKIISIDQGCQRNCLYVLTPTKLFFAADEQEARKIAREYNRDRVRGGNTLSLPVYWYWVKTYRLA